MGKNTWSSDDLDTLRKIGPNANEETYLTLFERNKKSCIEKYNNYIKEGLISKSITKIEIIRFDQLHKTCGNRWGIIARLILASDKEFNYFYKLLEKVDPYAASKMINPKKFRSPNFIKNYYHSCQRKNNKNTYDSSFESLCVVAEKCYNIEKEIDKNKIFIKQPVYAIPIYITNNDAFINYYYNNRSVINSQYPTRGNHTMISSQYPTLRDNR